MKYPIEHIERACLVSRMNIVKLNSNDAALLIRLCEMFVRPYIDYGCTTLTTSNKIQSKD